MAINKFKEPFQGPFQVTGVKFDGNKYYEFWFGDFKSEPASTSWNFSTKGGYLNGVVWRAGLSGRVLAKGYTGLWFMLDRDYNNVVAIRESVDEFYSWRNEDSDDSLVLMGNAWIEVDLVREWLDAVQAKIDDIQSIFDSYHYRDARKYMPKEIRNTLNAAMDKEYRNRNALAAVLDLHSVWRD